MATIEGLSGKRWPVHPHRQDDELLSSWFVRTAHANGFKAQSFGSQVFGRRAFVMTRDLDRCITDSHIKRLSEQTGSSPDELRDGLLTAYEGRVFGQQSTFGRTKWILPSVSYIRQRRRFGMQFCPLCLFFDKQPYFRKRWRMAFATICDIHGTMLHDRCPECGAPVVFFRNDVGDVNYFHLGDLVSCWECGFDLRRATAYSPSGPDGRTIIALRSLVTFHDLGWWSQGRDSIQYGPLYFEVLHHLAQCLTTRYGRRFLNAVEHETGWKAASIRERAQCGFESRPVKSRHELMMVILWLLEDWPDRFIRVSQSIGATQSQINDGCPLPYWFDSVLRLNLGGGFYSLAADEVKAAAAYLKSSDKEISASAIGRLLGRKGAQVVRPYVKQLSRPFSGDELQNIFAHLDAEQSRPSASCRQRLVCQRDRTILKLIQLTGWTYRKVSRLSVSETDRMALSPSAQKLPDGAAELLIPYLRETRQYMACDKSGNALFIKWKGGSLRGDAWRCRMQLFRRFLQDPVPG